MKQVKIKIIIFLFCIFLVPSQSCFISYLANDLNRKYYDFEENRLISALLINNNSELSILAISGNGTISNPYIIKNKVVDGDGGQYGLHIANTSSYFIIENCTIFNASYGIYLNNVTNGDFIQNSIYNNTFSGLYLLNSDDNDFVNNSIFNNIDSGIYLMKSGWNYLYNNTIVNNYLNGVVLNQSNINDLSENSIGCNNLSGITLVDSGESMLISNHIYNHSCGISLVRSNNTYIAYNYGDWNEKNVEQIECVNNFFVDNFIGDSGLSFQFIDLTLILIPAFSIIVALAGVNKLKNSPKIKIKRVLK